MIWPRAIASAKLGGKMKNNSSGSPGSPGLTLRSLGGAGRSLDGREGRSDGRAVERCGKGLGWGAAGGVAGRIEAR